MSMWNDFELNRLFKNKTPLIDVRAPIEFNDGAIPYSVNLPIMNDEERKLVGTCYKENGQSSAIKLGHDLVSGKLKEERMALWKSYITQNPEAEVFCMRGGLRSQISCQWLGEVGIKRTPLEGGYKRLRRFFLSWLDEAPLSPLIRIGGYTGSGKTTLLKQISNHIDLEDLASHRGSAFGPKGNQPAQISFENLIALELMHFQGKKIIVEDESVKLGKLRIPARFFESMRESPLIILEVTQEERLQNIFNDYVKESSADFFLDGLIKIEKRLGAKNTSLLSVNIREAFTKPMTLSNHQDWILTLLQEYYDPLYQKDLRLNQHKVVFRGSANEILAYLDQN